MKKAMRYTKHENKRQLLNFVLILLLFGSCLLTVACQTKEQKTTSILKKCQQILDSDNLSKATNCYAEAVLADPDNGGEISQTGKKAFFRKCVSYKEKKDYKNAIVCFDRFTALEPQMANSYFQLAAESD